MTSQNDNNSNKVREEMLISVLKDMGEVKVGIAEVKVDLREHMRRTLALEVQTEFLKKNVYMAYGIIAFLSFIAAAVKVFEVIVR